MGTGTSVSSGKWSLYFTLHIHHTHPHCTCVWWRIRTSIQINLSFMLQLSELYENYMRNNHINKNRIQQTAVYTFIWSHCGCSIFSLLFSFFSHRHIVKQLADQLCQKKISWHHTTRQPTSHFSLFTPRVRVLLNWGAAWGL